MLISVKGFSAKNFSPTFSFAILSRNAGSKAFNGSPVLLTSSWIKSVTSSILSIKRTSRPGVGSSSFLSIAQNPLLK